MSCDQREISRREAVARAAIKSAYGTEAHEFGVTLFVSHHLDELDEDYWLEVVGNVKPEPQGILDVLKLRSHWSPEDLDRDDDAAPGVKIFDFTLPGDVTNYVISVRFDDGGTVESISMES